MKLEDIKINLFEKANLSNIRRAVESGDSWAMLTSWRGDQDVNKNKSDFRELRTILRASDLGFIPLEGVGQEIDSEGNVVEAVEPSLFIPKITLDFAQKLMRKYRQDAIVYSGPETGEKPKLVWANGNMESIGEFRPGQISQFYSRIRGKPFTFG